MLPFNRNWNLKNPILCFFFSGRTTSTIFYSYLITIHKESFHSWFEHSNWYLKKRWLELIIHHSLTTLNWPSLQVKGNGVMHFVVFILDAVWLSITLDYVLCPSTRYQFEQMFFHWSDSDQGGSEHQINNHSFPAEVQFYGFNAHLFNNLSEAVMHPHGAVGVAIMIQVSDRGSNRGLKPLTSQLKKVQI